MKHGVEWLFGTRLPGPKIQLYDAGNVLSTPPYTGGQGGKRRDGGYPNLLAFAPTNKILDKSMDAGNDTMPGFYHSVAVSPFPLAVTVSVQRCRCRCRCCCVSFLLFTAVTERNFLTYFFAEQRNFTTAERRNGNGRTATEWWKPGIRVIG